MSPEVLADHECRLELVGLDKAWVLQSLNRGIREIS